MRTSTMYIPGILLLLGLVGLCVGIIIAAAWVISRRRSASTDPQCGHCGYIVRGVSSFTCPECGCDLREAGIVPAGSARPLGTLGWCVIWTLALPIPAVVLSVVLQSTIGPTPYKRIVARTVCCSIGSTSQDFSVFEEGQTFTWYGGRWRTPPTVPLTSVRACPQGLSPGRILEANLATGGYSFTDASGKTVSNSSGFGVDAVLSWLAANGMDPSHPDARQAAEGFLTALGDTPIIQIWIAKPGSPNKSSGVWVRAAPTNFTEPMITWWIFALWGGIWLLVWMAVIRRIVRHHRRRIVPAILTPADA